MIDDDFINRTKMAGIIDWFATLSESERAHFMNRLEAGPLDDAGREFLSILSGLDHEIVRITEEGE